MTAVGSGSLTILFVAIVDLLSLVELALQHGCEAGDACLCGAVAEDTISKYLTKNTS